MSMEMQGQDLFMCARRRTYHTNPFDVNTLINYGVTTEEVAGRLSAIFI